MSIIKSLQTFLASYPGMVLQALPVNTDHAGVNPTGYALAPSGNDKTTTDVLGNRTYRNNYVFYAKEAAADEVDRQDNYDFLEGLAEWLDDQGEAGNFPALATGYEVESINVSNVMLFDFDEDGTGLYQVQIQLTITRRR